MTCRLLPTINSQGSWQFRLPEARSGSAVASADPLGLLVDDGELAILEFVSQRHHSADPQALALGSRHLVANALGGDLSLELRKREQHVQSESAHRGGRVELLGHRDE